MASSAWTERASWNGFSRNCRCASRWHPARRNSMRSSSTWTNRRGGPGPSPASGDSRRRMRIDLHTHTTASDGLLAPERLVALAHDAGVGVLAVADHDSTESVDSAISAGARGGIEVIPGVVSSTEEAFEKYLGRNGPAYVERMKLSPPEAVQVILRTGGIPVLAHPGWGVKDEVIPALAETGLEGLEVYYPDHTPAMVTRYLEIAKRVGLLVTGGTDFHGGDLATKVPPGSQYVPAEVVERLKERHARKQVASRQ